MTTLSVIDSDVIAGRNVLYCENVTDAPALVGKRFKCVSSALEVTLQNVSTGGTAPVEAFLYFGDRVPPCERLKFVEVSVG